MCLQVKPVVSSEREDALELHERKLEPLSKITVGLWVNRFARFQSLDSFLKDILVLALVKRL